MSPAASSSTEMANASYSASNFASIFAFISTFDSIIRSNIREPEELSMIALSEEDDGVSMSKLKTLALCLLSAAVDRKAKEPLKEGQWPRLCTDLASDTPYILKGLDAPEAVADSVDAFMEQVPSVRIDVLYWLCEAALMFNSAVKSLVDREEEKTRKVTTADTADYDMVRLRPFAVIAKQKYWLFGNTTRQLYVEFDSKRGKGKLELLAQTVDEYVQVAETLRTERLHAFKELADRLIDEIVPYLEKQTKKRQRIERALQRQAVALASVPIYEARTRKRQRVNYKDTDDEIDAALEAYEV